MSARSRLFRVAAALVGLVIGVLGWVPASASAALPSYKLVHACTYDNPAYVQPSNDTAPERGPPVVGVHAGVSAGQAVIGRGPHGAAALPSASSQPFAYTYDARVQLAPAATVEEAVQAAGREVSSPRAAGVAAKAGTEVKGGLNLFKFKDPTSLRSTGWRDGDYFLRDEWKGTPKATWRGNSSLVWQEMSSGKPIYSSYADGAGNLIPTKGFLAAERNVLINRGWNFDTSTGAWVP